MIKDRLLVRQQGEVGVCVYEAAWTHASWFEGGGGVLVEWESPVPNSGSVLSSNPTKAFGFSLEGWYTEKRNLPFVLPENKFEQCHLW